MGGALTIIAGAKIQSAGVCFYGFHRRKPLTRDTCTSHCKGILPTRTIGVRRRQ